MAYEIPSWIRPPGNLAQDWLSGMQAGAGIARQRAELQQQAQIANLHADVQAQQMQMQAERQRQMLQMQKAYHDQITQIRQDQLAQQQQKIDLANQTAARKMMATMEYQKRVSGGEDPSAVMLELGPVMGASGGDMAAAMRAQREGEGKEYGDINTEDLGGGYRAVYRTGSPGLHVLAPPKSHEASLSAMATLAKAIPDLEMAAKTGGPNSIAAKVLGQIMPMIGGGSTNAAASGVTHKYNPQTKKIEPIQPSSPDQAQAPAAQEASGGVGEVSEDSDADY